MNSTGCIIGKGTSGTGAVTAACARCHTSTRCVQRLVVAALRLVIMLVCAGQALAAPYLPADDEQVLEHVAERNTPTYRQLKALQVVAAKAPQDLARATALATAYLRVAREEGDPRYLG